MKKFIAALLIAAMAFSLTACGEKESQTPSSEKKTADYNVAMITDYCGINDESFNQATYEGAKYFCDATDVRFNYYSPASDSLKDRIAIIDVAIADGYNVIITPGYSFASALAAVVPSYPDVKFIALDMSDKELSEAGLTNIPQNLFVASYNEEVSGYLAGFAAVSLGCERLGFLGGIAVPSVVNYGLGFVQGVNDAAAKIGRSDISLEYVYANTFDVNKQVADLMEVWFATKGLDVVFSCGGGLYKAPAEKAAEYGGKVIGVDVDQSTVINRYAENLTLTSATKGLSATVKTVLKELILNNNWDAYGGCAAELSLVSGTELEANYVQLPLETTLWSSNFTVEDYRALVCDIYEGNIVINSDNDVSPSELAKNIILNDNGTL